MRTLLLVVVASTVFSSPLVPVAPVRILLSGDSIVVGARAPKPKHAGKRATEDGDDAWQPCQDTDLGHTRKDVIPLVATVDASDDLQIATMTPAAVQQLYHAARNTCFIEDSEENSPTGGPGRQYEDKTFIVNKLTVVLRMRPASDVYQMAPLTLERDQGFFVADFYNRHSLNQYEETGKDKKTVIIPPRHSLLLWIGRDHNAILYTALLDLGNFPATHTPEATTVDVIRTGTLDTLTLVPAPLAAFARFKTPPHLNPNLNPSHNMTVPEDTWIGCSPGCCTSTSLLAFQNAANVSIRRKQSTTPASRGPRPPIRKPSD